MGKDTKNVFVVIVVVAVCAGAFYAGMQYGGRGGSGANGQRNNMAGARGQQFGGPQGGQRGAVRANGGFVNGEIIAKDDKSITIKMQDGGSKIVFLSTTAQISKTTEGSANDLVVGKQVSVIGSVNSDGSVSAQSVQIRPLSLVVKPAPTVTTGKDIQPATGLPTLPTSGLQN